MDEAERTRRSKEARRSCTRFLSGSRLRTAAEHLAALAGQAPDLLPDSYGEGPLIEELEAQVAGLLGKPAAVFMPSGTMAQQIALRCWADRTGSRAVALHPLTHVQWHERQALSALHGLEPRWLTSERRQPTPADVDKLGEPFGTLLVELPLRVAGYLLPTWAELTALVEAGRSAGARVHLDGARLWESLPYLGHSAAEVCGLFDTAYVSFYKGLEGPAGAALAGPADVIAEARVWQQRHGGRLFSLYPYVVAARHGLDQVLPRVPARVAHAAVVAEALAAVDGVRVHPSPPQSNAFQVYAAAEATALTEAAITQAEETGAWLLGGWQTADVPGWSMTECTVMDPGLEWTADDIQSAMSTLLKRARG